MKFDKSKFNKRKQPITLEYENENSEQQKQQINQTQQSEENEQSLNLQQNKNDNDDANKKKIKYNCKNNYELINDEMKKMLNFNLKTNNIEKIDHNAFYDKTQPKHVQDFQILVSILLSVQTKDTTADMVFNRLKSLQISIEKVLQYTDEELLELIKEVNFNKKKVNYIKKCAEIIKNQHNGIIPNDYEFVLSLPGIGPKIANLFMFVAFQQVLGLTVDTHVHRVVNRLEFVNTQTAEISKIELEKFIDKKYWGKIDLVLVDFGQKICTKLNPKCSECTLNQKCPEGRRRKVGKMKI